MCSGLIHGFNLSTTTDSNNQSTATKFVVRPSIGYEICGLAAKDHLKINEGEVKGHQLVLLM